MCLLCYYPPQAETDLNALENSCLNNPDGFGWSALDTKSNEIKTFHSMNPDEAVTTFEAERKRNPETYALFHARLATAGTVTTDNCHPFRIGGGVNAVLGHNGHLPVEIRKGDQRSDTRVFAEDLFPQRFQALDSRKRFKKLEKWARGNKLVILNADSRLQKPVYLVNEAAGLWDSGVWYSNTSYSFDYSRGFYGLGNYWSTDSLATEWGVEEYDLTCPDCQAFPNWDLVEQFGTCDQCGFCFDCYEADGACLCYSSGQFYSVGGAYDSRSTLGA